VCQFRQRLNQFFETIFLEGWMNSQETNVESTFGRGRDSWSCRNNFRLCFWKLALSFTMTTKLQFELFFGIGSICIMTLLATLLSSKEGGNLRDRFRDRFRDRLFRLRLTMTEGWCCLWQLRRDATLFFNVLSFYRFVFKFLLRVSDSLGYSWFLME